MLKEKIRFRISVQKAEGRKVVVGEEGGECEKKPELTDTAGGEERKTTTRELKSLLSC